MPNPASYKDKSHYMSQCMKITKQEGMKHDQSVAQCLSTWRQEKGKDSSISEEFLEGKPEKSGKPSVFLGGSCDDDNAWREEIKKEFKDNFEFIDPYDSGWKPEDNIYDELAAISMVNHVIFYGGGKGTEKEKEYMERTGKDFESFDNMNELKAHLTQLSKRPKKACISEYIRKIARTIEAKKRSYGIVGIQVPGNIASKIKKWSRENIPESEICPENGREDDTHITVLYGIISDDKEPVEALLKEFKPFTVTLNKTSMFNNDPKNDVLKIGINSPDLQKIHMKLKEALKPEGTSFPEYRPHITISYLKKGYVEKYLDKDCSDFSFKVDSLFFSNTKDKKINIKLVE